MGTELERLVAELRARIREHEDNKHREAEAHAAYSETTKRAQDSWRRVADAKDALLAYATGKTT